MSDPMEREWRVADPVGPHDGAIVKVQLGRHRVAIARVAGAVVAFNDFCPHVAGPMHRGELNGTVLTCPLHGWRFDLADSGREIHGYRPLQMFECREADGHVHVVLPDSGPTDF